MKNILKKITFTVFLALVFFIGNQVEATTNVHLNIAVGGNYLYDKDISVSSCDSDNNGSLDPETAYCALLQSGINVSGSWNSYGYFLNGIGNIDGYADASGDWHYWEFYINENYASVGIASYVLNPGDVILLNFLNPSEEDINKSSSIDIGGTLWRDEFSIENAIKFLSLQQQEDGSFGQSLYTDWVTIGIAKNSIATDDLKNKLKEYLKNENFKAESITDYERHAMALMSLGINPYSGTTINYIKNIINSFDGEQIGDKNLISDDIFGLIVLQNAGYSKEDKVISTLISNIMKTQGLNGSWGSVDMTAASILSMHDFIGIDGVEDSIRKGYKFIKKNEDIKKRKSFGNVFSASWAMQSFSLEDWYEDEVERTLKFLARRQDNEDGSIKEERIESRIWATAYALPASEGKTWNDILDDFSKEL